MNVAHFLEDHIKRLDEVPSLVFEEKEYTNVWIRENSNRLANGLKSLGVEKGDRVVVSLANSPEVSVAFQAIFRIGGIIAPIMFLMTPDETEFILSDCEAKVFITSQDAADKIQKAMEMPGISHIIIGIFENFFRKTG